MAERINRGIMEDLAIIVGLVIVQLSYAGNAVFVSYSMALGFSSLTIIIFTSLATFLILFPISFYFERFFFSASISH